MSAIDLHTIIDPSEALAAQSIVSNTTTVGVIIDTQNFESLEFLIQSATITDGTYAPLVEESADSGMAGSNVVDSDFLLGTTANATFILTDDNLVKRIGYVGKLRYVRLSIVSTGVTTGGAFSSAAVLGNARSQPTDGS